MRAAGWAKRLGGGEERFDGFVAENEQRGHRPEAAGERFVTAAVPDAADDVLPAEGRLGWVHRSLVAATSLEQSGAEASEEQRGDASNDRRHMKSAFGDEQLEGASVEEAPVLD
jgi:hypothetical protein